MFKTKKLMSINIKKNFDGLFNGFLAYIFYSLIFYFGTYGFGTFFKFFKKNADSFYRKNKFFEYKFRYHFKTKDFFRAYSIRLKQAIFLEKYQKIETNYLDILWHEECHDLFDLTVREKKYLFDRKKTFSLVDSKKKEQSVLFFGPSADINRIKEYEYDFDFLCINKPINPEKLKVDPKKIILVLNNIWSIKKTKEVYEWINQNKDSHVFSPNNIFGKNYNESSFNKIPSFGLGSLMGLQRAVTLVISEFDVKKLRVEGFDFYLSMEPIKSWYPSLYAEEGFKNQKQGILNATLNHDYLLNFLFMKKIKKMFKENLEGEINIFLEKDVEYVLRRLKKLLS